MLKWTGEAKEESLSALNMAIESAMEDEGLPMKVVTQVLLVVEEIFVNIARYAYAPGSGEATVELFVEKGLLTLRFTDRGTPYDPLSHEDPDITKAVEDREIGGLGILLTKRIMSDARYERRDGQNIFTLTKEL